MVRTTLFQGVNPGSIPGGTAMTSKEQNQDIKKLTWRAAEYHFVEKNIAWHGLIGLMTLLLVIFALSQKNFFFAFFVILAAMTLFSFGRRRPPIASFEISEEGIAINNSIRYDYDQLESFAIINRPGRLDEILIKKRAIINPFVNLPADAATAAKAEKILEKKLEKFEHEPTIMEAIIIWLGF